MIHRLVCLCLALSPLSPLWAGTLYGTAEFGWGALSGIIQTPKGGTIGTTSYERPSFAELNHHQDHFFETTLGLASQCYFIEGDFILINPKAEGTLNTALTTHAQTIPLDSPFSMQLHFDWYTLATGRIFKPWGESSWGIIPRVEGNMMKYRYDFSAPAAQSQRAFNLITAGIGCALTYPLSDRWLGFMQARCNLPLSNFHYIKADVGIAYSLLQYGCSSFNPFLKMGVIRIDYEDEQEVPNHIRYQNAPWISIGFLWDLIA